MSLKKVVITRDDLQKSEQYHHNLQRKLRKEETEDLRTYLESLQTKVTIRPATKTDLSRIHQLFTKTNQFNVSTIRYSMGEVENFLQSSRFDLTVFEAEDQFGTLGTIGLYLIEIENSQKLHLDSFVMSCRAPGREIESAVMNSIKKKYLVNKSNVQLEAQFIPTAKNKPADNFYPDQGFQLGDENNREEREYHLTSSKTQLVLCDWIDVTETGQ